MKNSKPGENENRYQKHTYIFMLRENDYDAECISKFLQ